MLTAYRKPAIVAVRSIQLLCIGFVVTGFIWSTTDLLMVSVLVSSPVSPLSLLFMLYGTVGSFVTEASARWLARNSDEPQKK